MRYAGFAVLVAIGIFPAFGHAQMDRGARHTRAEPVVPPGVAKNMRYPDVEYVSGHEGFEVKLKGQLVVTANGVHFFDTKGKTVFALPMSTILNAEYSRDIRDPSVGKKLLFGSLAGDRKQDFLTLTTETDSTAEGVVFKTKQNVGSGITAKINFYARKYHASRPAITARMPAAVVATEFETASLPELIPGTVAEGVAYRTEPLDELPTGRAVDDAVAAAARSQSTPVIDHRANPQPSPASTEPKAPAPGRFNGELLRNPDLRQALDDVVRSEIGTEYQEVRWGVLRLMIGTGYDGSAVTYYLNRLWNYYMHASDDDGTVVIELWQGGRKLGEYTKEGLLVGPEFGAPR